jgi:molybdate transport system permease protein
MRTGGQAAFAAAAVLAAASVAAALLYLAAWAGPESLQEASSGGLLGHSIALSLATATASTATALLLGIPVAYALSRRIVPAGAAVEVLLVAPFAMPPVAVGAAALLLLAGPARPLDRLLGIVFTARGLVAAQFLVVYPMVVRVLRSAFDSVPERLEAVARSLGCSWWCSFTRVVLPMARRGVLAAALLGFLRSLGEFGASAVLAGAKHDTATLPIAIYLSLSGGDAKVAALLALVAGLVALAGAATLRLVESRGAQP